MILVTYTPFTKFQLEKGDDNKEDVFSRYLLYCCQQCDFKIKERPEFKMHLDENHNAIIEDDYGEMFNVKCELEENIEDKKESSISEGKLC